MTSTYAKPFLDVDQQLDRIEGRGLALGNRDEAYRLLEAVGYYRLSGYWYPFRQPRPAEDDRRPSEFIEGASLDEVRDIYRFDEHLRSMVLRAISTVEVSLRFRVGHLLGRRGPFAHTDASELDDRWTRQRAQRASGPNCTDDCDWTESEHQVWTRKQQRAEEHSGEAFVAHFDAQYGKPLPVWTATELMSFGTLNLLFGGLRQVDRQQIAADFDLFLMDGNGDAAALSNWLEHLRQTRNTCAHHGRLWNRNHTAPLAAPDGLDELRHLRGTANAATGTDDVSRAASRLYGTLVVLAYLLRRIENSNRMRDAIRGLIEEFADGDEQRLYWMGFPEGWRDEVIWQPGYGRDPVLVERAEALRGVELFFAADAARQLWKKPDPKGRPGLLNLYRRNGAVLSVPGMEAHRYPSFQFDPATGDVPPVVVEANRRLLRGAQGSEEQRWDALRWWNRADDGLGGSSPKRALLAAALTMDDLDRRLPPIEDD